jgi:hypothetical protein
MAVRVFSSFRFSALHSWPGAPERVLYLATPHRHLFHVRIEWRVEHDDRDVEFIAAAEDLRAECERQAPHAPSWSCEHWARWLAETPAARRRGVEMDRTGHAPCRVEVSEDGENGAVWEASS